MKHTPGPWAAWIGGSKGYAITGPAAAASSIMREALKRERANWSIPMPDPIVISAPDKTCVALVTEKEQDARLIAKAPEMYELLQGVMDSVGDSDRERILDLMEEIDNG